MFDPFPFCSGAGRCARRGCVARFGSPSRPTRPASHALAFFSASSSATYATSDSFSFSRRCCSHDQAPVAVQQQAARRLFDRLDAPRRWLVTEPHLATHATRGDVLPLSAQEEILERFDIHSKTLFEDAPHERLGDQWETVPPRLLGLGHEGSPEAHQVVREPLVRQGFRRRAPFPLSARASPWG